MSNITAQDLWDEANKAKREATTALYEARRTERAGDILRFVELYRTRSQITQSRAIADITGNEMTCHLTPDGSGFIFVVRAICKPWAEAAEYLASHHPEFTASGRLLNIFLTYKPQEASK